LAESVEMNCNCKEEIKDLNEKLAIAYKIMTKMGEWAELSQQTDRIIFERIEKLEIGKYECIKDEE